MRISPTDSSNSPCDLIELRVFRNNLIQVKLSIGGPKNHVTTIMLEQMHL